MIRTNLADYTEPLRGLMPGATAELVAVTDTHDEATALAELAPRPAIVEMPSGNPYGLYRVFSLRVPAAARPRL